MNWLIAKLFDLLFLKKIAGKLAWAHLAIVGKRSEILAVLLAVVYILQTFGAITVQQARGLETLLLGMIGPTLADKITRYAPLKDKIAEELQKRLENNNPPQ